MGTERQSLDLTSRSVLPRASYFRRFARFIIPTLVGLAAMLHSEYARTQAACQFRYPECDICQSGLVGLKYDGICYSCPGRYCRPGAPGTAQAIAAALGPNAAEAKGDTVFLKTDPQAPQIAGVSVDLDSVKRLSKTHPAAALVLLQFHPEFFHSNLNMLRGAAALSGMPTQQSFQLALQHVPGETVAASFAAIQPGTFVQVRWDSQAPDSDALEVTFYTEAIDESVIVKRLLASPVHVLVSRSQLKVLSIAAE